MIPADYKPTLYCSVREGEYFITDEAGKVRGRFKDDMAVLEHLAWAMDEIVRLREAQHDPTGDLIAANRDELLRKHEEAIRRIRPLLDSDDAAAKRLAIRVLDALGLFHPMHGESWQGWPESTLTVRHVGEMKPMPYPLED